MCLGEIGWGDVYWMSVTQDRDQCWALVNTVMNHEPCEHSNEPCEHSNEPSDSIKSGEFLD
jgi:hypothetical protein